MKFIFFIIAFIAVACNLLNAKGLFDPPTQKENKGLATIQKLIDLVLVEAEKAGEKFGDQMEKNLPGFIEKLERNTAKFGEELGKFAAQVVADFKEFVPIAEISFNNILAVVTNEFERIAMHTVQQIKKNREKKEGAAIKDATTTAQ
uniref:DUF148 domain-containing protein n=1 Tax=Rhabditophanes sp. KR3021 TaxID=114890 RepID=A0AC35TVG8_9BILA